MTKPTFQQYVNKKAQGLVEDIKRERDKPSLTIGRDFDDFYNRLKIFIRLANQVRPNESYINYLQESDEIIREYYRF